MPSIGELRSIREVLDERYPFHIATVGVNSSQRPGPEFESCWVLWKGIVAGALMALQADRVHLVNEEDADQSLLDQVMYLYQQDGNVSGQYEILQPEDDHQYSTGGQISVHYDLFVGPEGETLSLLIFRPLAESAPADLIFFTRK